MNRRSKLIIAATLVALAGGALALAALEEESQVRYVADVLGDPDGHALGSYTLLGVPQPAFVHVQAAGGGTQTMANPDAFRETQTVQPWTNGSHRMVSTHTVSVNVANDTGHSTWHVSNVTRVLGQPDVVSQSNHTWTETGPHTIMPIQDFTGEQAIWGIYRGGLKDSLQPKPSQFAGHMSHERGTWIFNVAEYTAGCSSKFIPPEAQERYQNETAVFP